MDNRHRELARNDFAKIRWLRLSTLKKDSAASAWFDMFRWIAALYVMVFHLRPVVLLGLDKVHSPGVTVKTLYGVTSLGYQFVMLFFILSGFLISSKVLLEIRQGSWSWSKYLIDRVVRLWVVLLPALAFTLVLAQFQSHLFKDYSYFASSLTPSVLMGNMFFLQGIFVTNFGQNLPLWSLTYEFWYYILFPCLVLTFHSKKPSHKVLHGVIFVAIGLMVGKSIMEYFMIWMIGFLLVVIPSISSRRWLLWLGIPLTFLATLFSLVVGKWYISNYHVPNMNMVASFPVNILVSLTFTGVLYVILHSLNETRSQGWLQRSGRLATFSYSLYLIHYPILNLIRVWLGDGHWGLWVPNTLHMLDLMSIGFVILVLAWVFSKLTESHTSVVRQRVRGFLYRKLAVDAVSRGAAETMSKRP